MIERNSEWLTFYLQIEFMAIRMQNSCVCQWNVYIYVFT